MKINPKLVVLTVLAAGMLATQAQDKVYAVVDYMHVPIGRSQDDYIALEKLWLRLHQKTVDSGQCLGWCLNRVENGGRNQFVTVRLYNSLDNFAKGWPESISGGLYSSEENAKMQNTGATRILTHREIWGVESSAFKTIDPDPQAKIEVDFIKPKPGKANDYYSMERKYYQKIHKARIDAGAMLSWQFLSRMAPGGADGEFTFVTLNTFPASGGGWDDKVVSGALTKEEWEKVPKAVDLRTIVRQEIWHPVLHTTPPKKKS